MLFGEALPAAALRLATELARAASLVLVVGSSLEVWPVAGLPLEAQAFAVVNRGPTAFDDLALLKVDAGAGETLSRGARPALEKHGHVVECYDCPMTTSTPTRPSPPPTRTSYPGSQTRARRRCSASRSSPAGKRRVTAINDLRSRVDEMAKKVRGIDALDARVAKLEREVGGTEEAEGAAAASGASQARRLRRARSGTTPRHEDAERPRLELDPGRRRPRLLSVELDRKRLVRVHRHDPAAQELEAGMGRCLPR